MKKRSSSVRGTSVKRTSSPVQEKKKRKPQRVHNLPPAGWMNKVKNYKCKEVGVKGASKGRSKPVYHFWTKSKIKLYIKKQVEYRVHVRKQKAAMPIKNYGRGWKTSNWKWLPSEAELKEMEADKKAEEEEEAGDQGEGEEEGGGGGGGGGGGKEDKLEKKEEEEEEEFMLPGMGSDSEF